MKLKNFIPNALTILNLVCGLSSITLILQGNLVFSALFIFLAAIFDFLDGTAARVLDARSLIGKDLDSLADVVSFGVAPGILMFQLLMFHCEGSCNLLERMYITPYFAFLIPVCSAIRLAKFNSDPRQEDSFIGMPTPANAMFFASIPLILMIQARLFSLIHLDFLVTFFSNSRVLAILTVFFSYLLISDFRLFSIKFKTTGWKQNKVQYIFLILALILIFLFSVSAIPLIIFLYFLLSLVFQRSI